MVRIDDERWGEGEKESSSSILFLWKRQWREVMHGTKNGCSCINPGNGVDAWNKKTGAHALILEMELMHEAAK